MNDSDPMVTASGFLFDIANSGGLQRNPYVLEAIRGRGEFALYRGRQHGNPSPVLVVAPTAEHSLPQVLRRLEWEYSLGVELEPAWAAKPLALTHHEGRTILVLADPGGEPLDCILERDKEQPLDLARLLRLAVNLATALGHAHHHGLIHKDVKPENALVDDAGHAWLTGFGIASRLPRERQAPSPPEIIAGTLAYMSPEQTGRMNRSIDTRSDLYSLGVTLYEMFTGVLPFSADDPLEWVHCHIARQPVAPVNRCIVPEPLSAIIMRLLAKNAEERYQTAAGLGADLRRCLSEWESHGRIDPFPLGTEDLSDRLLIPEKLYGREREVDTLLAAFDRVVAQGTVELVLVSGYSGVGKSSVVNELHKVLVPPRGLFAAGKFDQYKRDIPYATLAQAFQSLIRPLLGKSEAELRDWRNALHEALDPNGPLIVDLVPELKLIIGEQPPVPDLPPQDAQRRFQLVFRRFIGVFARPEHPLALFLDDLQWLDAASLDLLEDLLTHPDLQYLMLIGAYRDNEVNSTHPLRSKLEAIRQDGALVQEITLAPLAREDTGRLIADSLHCEPESVTPLAQLVHEKTAGNPFFAVQFISALAEEALLTFDHGAGRWSWDLNHIQAKGYTDNVVELMVGKLNRLSGQTQKALQEFACLGNSAEIATLSIVHGTSEDELHSDLWEAVRIEYIVRLESSYKFVHDRVQEAAYSLIPEQSRAETHLGLGRLLAAGIPPERREGAIFEIVNQLNRGAALTASQEERDQIAELDLIAGKRAKDSAAYASALTYLIAGAALLADDSWERRHELTFALELHRAECEFLTGELATAEERLAILSSRAANIVEQSTVTCLRVDLYTTLDQTDRAVDVSLDYLRYRGVEWSPHPPAEEGRREYERIWKKLGGRAIEELIDQPLMSDPELLATMDVLTKVSSPAWLTDANLFSLVICRAVDLSLEHGTSDASSNAYIYLGIIAGSHFGNYKAGFRFGRLGYELVEKRGLRRFQVRVYVGFADLVMPWTQHVNNSRDLLRRAFDAANKIGELTFAAYSRADLPTILLAAGDPLVEVQRETEDGLEFSQNARFGLMIDVITGQLGLIRTLRGLTHKFGSFDDEQFDELRFERHLAGNPALALPECFYWIRKLQARLFAGDYTSAVDASLRAQRLLSPASIFFEIAEYHFYGALAQAASYGSATADQRQRHFEALSAHHRQLEVWAENCPENFENRAALVGAEIARIEGRSLDAMDLYERAIRSARANGFVPNEALANELAARFYRARGFEKIADSYLREARYCYTLWGAEGKVKQLDERYPRLREGRAITPLTMIAPPAGQLDVETVVKASQAISSEIVLPALIEKLLKIAVENAGAERGLLILLRSGEPRIEAEATVGQGRVEVTVREAAVTPFDLPQSALHYVTRTQERVLLDDASADNVYSKDEYVQLKRSRSVLCLPIVKQAKVVGALYLENNLTPGVFTPDRVTVLLLLASQAAISLENATLFSDLQRSETYLAQGQSIGHTGTFGRNVLSGETYWSEEFYKIFEFDRSVRPALDRVFERVHPEDRARVQKTIEHATHQRTDFDIEFRLLRRDDSVKYVHVVVQALEHASGELEFVGAVTDITAAKQSEEKILQSEKEARQLLDLSPLHITELGPDGARLYTNRASLDYYGVSLEEWQDVDLPGLLHPQDTGLVANDLPEKFQCGSPFEFEVRLKRKDGQYRWFHYRLNPMSDEQGRITRWYAAATDIEELKLAEQRLQEENVALREEITRSSMFEEIVGTSQPLREVLGQIAKVAPTDSTVLISGETGTGKELVARAIHRRSNRSKRSFISVNCGAIPSALIASELFGYEKGAFTGAMTRRAGRFEAADGGTIFLDEVGELPIETQTALLRVLQEREFERIGSTEPLKVDVRVVAATNRDLGRAVLSGAFREDLFYRLNVFPLRLPSLRERADDIPLLVEYLIDRYGKKAGKSFKHIARSTLDLFQSYNWPGNIRELQNVVERAVILSDSETFSVDKSWLKIEATPERRPRDVSPGSSNDEEKRLIEAALAESRGRISGGSGAAAKLGIPRQTLESKIMRLGINKHRFRT